MSLEELISIERVEFELSKERVQETYAVILNNKLEILENKLENLKNKLEKMYFSELE